MTALSCRDYEVVPSILSCLHRTYDCDPAATEKSTLAIVGFANERPSHEDLTSFTTDFRTEAEAATFIVIRVNTDEYHPSNPYQRGEC